MTDPEKRKLLIDFATFQWENLPESIDKIPLVGTVFNVRTVDRFLTPPYIHLDLKESKPCRCTCANSLEYENCNKNCERREAELHDESKPSELSGSGEQS